MLWVNAIISGILLGGLYALLAAGLSLMFGVMRIVNLAHGALAMLAAYFAYWLIQRTGMSPFLTIIVVVPVMAGIGYLIQRGIFNRALTRGGLAPLLAAFGLAVVVTQLMQAVFSADTRRLDPGPLGIKSIPITSTISIGVLPLITCAVGILVIVALQVFISRTSLGRAMRAASDDPDTVQLMGISQRQVYALATALALASVGLAGIFIGMRTQFTPGFGDVMLIFAFEAVIIGGLGSLWGTLVGGMVLGVAQTMGAQFNPAWGILIGNLVFLIILAFRPEGLLPKAVTQ